ncbi:MAG: tetratricopeptide repeat protein [Pseudomonadota bacterium]
MRFISIALLIGAVTHAAQAEIVPVPEALIEEITDLGRMAYKVRDYESALRHWRAAEDLGGLPAHANVGLLYLRGHGVPKDQSRGLAMLEDAARNGPPRIAYILAQVYQRPGLDIDEWMRAVRRKAAGASDVKFPLKANSEKSEQWMRRAAEGGIVAAMVRLSGLAGSSRPKGPESDHCRAPVRAKFTKRVFDTATGGSAEAADAVGKAYFYGYCLAKDLEKAEQFFRLAVAGGWSGRNLGRVLIRQEGKGAEGLRILHALADKGGKHAMVELAAAYRGLYAVEADFDQAVDLLLRSLMKGTRGWHRLRDDEDPEFVRKLKSRLQGEGHYNMPVDGNLDQSLKNALLVYPKPVSEFDFSSIDEDFGLGQLRHAINSYHGALADAEAAQSRLKTYLEKDDGSEKSGEIIDLIRRHAELNERRVGQSLSYVNTYRRSVGAPELDMPDRGDEP